MRKRTNAELLQRSLNNGVGAAVETIPPEEVGDDELEYDWRHARFLLQRIYRRLTETGEFNAEGT